MSNGNKIYLNPFRIIWNNRDTLLLAFLLSVAVWVSAVIASDPNREDTIEGGVALEIVGLDDSLILNAAPPKSIDVDIRAPESLWLEIEQNPDLVQAFLDFTDVEKGEQIIPVEVTVGISPVEVVNVVPSSITVIIEEEITSEFIPTVNLIGEPAEGFEVQSETIEVNNNEPVVVTGPESRMRLVAGVEANISVLDSRDTISTVTNLSVIDESGRQISGVTLNPTQVDVTVPIVQSGGYRDVAVRVETTGQPASGYTVVNIEVEPPTITVYSADSNLVETMSGVVSTLPLDLTDVSGDVDIRLGLVLPEGVSMVGTEQSVQVKVGIAAIASSMTMSVPIEALELGSGLQAELSLESVDVFLTGPAQVMETLTTEDIVIYILLSGLEPGTYLIEPGFDILIEGVEITSINPDRIEVIITESEDAGAINPEETATPELTPEGTPSGFYKYFDEVMERWQNGYR